MDEVAVLTGDIVNSRNLSEESRVRLYKTFPQLSKNILRLYPQDVTYPMSNFRGDSWQLVVNRPQKSLKISLYIRLYICFTFGAEKLDTRIAIGIGKVNFVPTENVSAGDGPAFLASGHLLESFKSERMAIAFSEKKELAERIGLDNMIGLLDHIVTGWSPSQCQAVFWSLQGLNQKEIAAHWQPKAISQAAVSKSLRNTGLTQIMQSLSLFESLFAKSSI